MGRYFIGVISLGLVLLQIPVLNAQPEESAAIDSLRQEIRALHKQIQALQTRQSDDELQTLRNSARAVAEEPGTSDDQKSKTFVQKSRSLQALNPEISLVGDVFAVYNSHSPEHEESHTEENAEHPHEEGGHGELRTGFLNRVFAVHLQSNLDPFSLAKASVEIGTHGLEVTEAYITWTNPLPRTSLTFGKFRQQFGVINRWHEHALDQAFLPLPIQLYMGEEGLFQVGGSADILLPSIIAHANELTVQVTNASNPTLFSGEDFSLPAGLVHLKNYYDLTTDTYLEWGLSGLAGTNDNQGFDLKATHSWTYLGGLDLTVSWKPARQGLYKGITWRSELFTLRKEHLVLEPVTAMGGFTYVDYRLSRSLVGGVRLDIAQPPEPGTEKSFQWQVVPYLTFWQSEYVYLRFQWNYLNGSEFEEPQHRFLLQVDWSVGPHKHEKY